MALKMMVGSGHEETVDLNAVVREILLDWSDRPGTGLKQFARNQEYWDAISMTPDEGEAFLAGKQGLSLDQLSAIVHYSGGVIKFFETHDLTGGKTMTMKEIYLRSLAKILSEAQCENFLRLLIQSEEAGLSEHLMASTQSLLDGIKTNADGHSVINRMKTIIEKRAKARS